MKQRRHAMLYVGAAAVVFLLALCGGSFWIWQWGVPAHADILWQLRLPRAVAALLLGGTLAALGATYQTLFRNPLAEPYLLGVSNAVMLGLAVAEILLGIPAKSPGYFGVGIGSGALATFALLSLCRGRFTASGNRILLFGTGLQFVLSSLLFLLVSYHAQKLGGSSLKWFFGQLGWLSLKDTFSYFLFSAPALFLLWFFGPKLDRLALGEGTAASLGLRPERERVLFLVITAYLTVVSVFFAGAVGFVGLIAPHLALKWFPPENSRSLLLSSAALGSVFLLFSDFASRALLPPFEFPVGVITTVLGGPFFLWALASRRHLWS